MKKLAFALILLAATGAHATKARLESLNQDSSGSYFIQDTRNIFLNPAQLSIMKQELNFEWGKKDRSGLANDIPENEGGFVIALGTGKLAAQLGRVSNFDRLVREVNGNVTDVATNVAGANFGEGQNNIDIMYALPNRWGFGATLTRSKTALTAPNRQSSVQALDLHAGILMDKFEAFGSLLVGASTQTDLASGNGKLNEPVGLSGGFSLQPRPEFKVFGHLSYDAYTAKISGISADYEGKRINLNGGAVYLRNIDANSHLFASGELYYLDHVATGSQGVPDEKYQVFSIPLNIGIEAKANDWSNIRASVRQDILLGSTKTTTGNTANDNSKWENAPNSTAVAFGVGGRVDKFNFDVALVQSLTMSDSAHALASMEFAF